MTIPDFTPVSTNDDTPDFTPSSNVKFTLYGEAYFGVAELTLEDSFNYETLSTQLGNKEHTTEQRIETMKAIIRTLLEPDSADRFIAGLKNRHKPIGLSTTMKIFKYVMDQYGDRPTTPESDSSVGSDNPAPGTPSTESSSPEVSMS